MIKVENIETYGWEAALRGMRNPMNSWDKSDSFNCPDTVCLGCKYYDHGKCNSDDDCEIVIGSNDMDLMQRLFKGGPVHRKYLRMITVTMDIVAPLYWWKEFDTYKVGTVCNSCSTMHKIQAKKFELDDFSHEHLRSVAMNCLENTIQALNEYRMLYLESKEKSDWWNMIQLLPSSYNQRRTVQFSYETLFNILEWRSNHKLDEWVIFCDVLKTLPYVKKVGE